VNAFGRFAVPPGVVSDTDFTPAAAFGVTAMTVFESTTLIEAAAVPPNDTEVVPARSVPTIVTAVPPLVGPADGAMEVIEGATR
jgi:hypothetical protein